MTEKQQPLSDQGIQEIPEGLQPLHKSINERLGSVAVVHPSAHTLTENAADIGYYVDAITLGGTEPTSSSVFYHGSHVLDRASELRPLTEVVLEESIKKQQVIASLRSAVTMAAVANVETLDGQPKIAWERAAGNLLELGRGAAHEPQKDNLLVSAVIASQFAEDDAARLDFLQGIYEHGDNEAIAVACARSPIVLVHEESIGTSVGQLYPVARLANAFRADPAVIEKYHRLLSADHQPVSDDALAARPPRAKAVQKQVSTELEQAVTSADTQDLSQRTSLRGKEVGGSIRDPHKIERFALQQMFIKQQMKDVLGERQDEGDLTHSPLAVLLAGLRTDATNIVTEDEVMPIPGARRDLAADLIKLTADAQQVMRYLSQPVIDTFATDRQPADGYDGLTSNQMVTVRFREILQEMAQHAAVGQYVNLNEFIDRRSNGSAAVLSNGEEVWTLSEDGAAAPPMATSAIITVVGAAQRQSATPEELLTVLQANRRPLLAIATHHIEGNLMSDVIDAGSAELVRDEHGTLRLETNWKSRTKDRLEVYSAVALGCPALREVHESRSTLTAAEKLAHGSANYIDHVLTAIINEAYQRGLLDTTRYGRAANPPIPEQKQQVSSDGYDWPDPDTEWQ